MNAFDNFLTPLRERFPKVKLISKSDSFLMKVISILLFFNKSFMISFVTTINNKIYLPLNWRNLSDEEKIIILCHESVHLEQQRRYTFPLYCLMYLCWPLPFLWSYGRYKLELEAYTETIRQTAKIYGLKEVNVDFIIDMFLDSSYGWMMSLQKEKVIKYFENLKEEISKDNVS